jgi:hypothetical protein
MRFIWVDGRFSWGLVGAVVFLSASVIASDIVWRVLRIQVDTLLIYAAATDIVAAAVLILAVRFVRRCMNPRPRASCYDPHLGRTH